MKNGKSIHLLFERAHAHIYIKKKKFREKKKRNVFT